jgi:hypothetical protein
MEISRDVEYKSLNLLKILSFFDPYKLTTFEFSFKIKNKKMPREVRFLNMDPDGYSCKNKRLFLKRIELFEKILEKKCRNKDYKLVVNALKDISNTPLDIYFGADIKKDDYTFGFWLIFGGVKRDGKVNFWSYDFSKIVNSLLQDTGMKKSVELRKDILNFGFDITPDELYYKVYYLCREKIMQNSIFTELMKEINSKLNNFKYFYFWSEMYTKEGNKVKEKLFIEFLEDLWSREKKLISILLLNISKIKKIDINPHNLIKKISKIGGRISLISFEADGTLTFYMRLN